jgi:hypothetical protein
MNISIKESQERLSTLIIIARNLASVRKKRGNFGNYYWDTRQRRRD